MDKDADASAGLSSEDLDKIKNQATSKAKRLAAEKQDEIDDLMNEIIYTQLKKLRAKMTYVKGFWDAYEIEGSELALMQEQCLRER
jgi:hypothetical protein